MVVAFLRFSHFTGELPVVFSKTQVFDADRQQPLPGIVEAALALVPPRAMSMSMAKAMSVSGVR